QPAARLPYSEFSQLIENEAPAAPGMVDGVPVMPLLPEFTLHAAPGPAPRLDFSAPPIEVTPGPPPSGKLMRRLDAHGAFPPDAIPLTEASLSGLSELRPLGQIHESFIV